MNRGFFFSNKQKEMTVCHLGKIIEKKLKELDPLDKEIEQHIAALVDGVVLDIPI